MFVSDLFRRLLLAPIVILDDVLCHLDFLVELGLLDFLLVNGAVHALVLVACHVDIVSNIIQFEFGFNLGQILNRRQPILRNAEFYLPYLLLGQDLPASCLVLSPVFGQFTDAFVCCPEHLMCLTRVKHLLELHDLHSVSWLLGNLIKHFFAFLEHLLLQLQQGLGLFGYLLIVLFKLFVAFDSVDPLLDYGLNSFGF